MNTIKIKTQTVLENVKEVELPCYVKDSAHFYKIFSDKQCICVTEMNDGGNHAIGIHHASLPFSNSNYKESNEEEFNAAYHRISGILNTL